MYVRQGDINLITDLVIITPQSISTIYQLHFIMAVSAVRAVVQIDALMFMKVQTNSIASSSYVCNPRRRLK